MKRAMVVELTLCVLLTITVSAVAQEAAPLKPNEVVAKLQATILVDMVGAGQGDIEDFLEESVIIPEGLDAEQLMRLVMMVSMVKMFLAAPPDQLVQIEAGTAIVKLQPQPFEFVLVQQDGKWKIDVAVTYERLPARIRKLIEPLIRGREKAQQVACLSNLRQMILAALMYAEDHDDTLPDASKWMDQLLPYLENEQIFKCPEAPNLEYGYAMNKTLGGVNIKDIINPEKTVLFFDSDLGTRNAAGGWEVAAYPPRHDGGNNYAYLDGHVGWSRDIPLFGPGGTEGGEVQTPR